MGKKFLFNRVSIALVIPWGAVFSSSRVYFHIQEIDTVVFTLI